MPITLNWVDNNDGVEKFQIFRSDTPFAESALPAVLAEGPMAARSYTDSTVVRNKTYYYRVGHIIAGELTLSELKVLAFMPYTGPGPQKLLRGTWDAGYFGTFPIEELFAPIELLALVGLPASAVPTAVWGLPTLWHKFVYKGKILFWPDRGMAAGASISYMLLYTLGLVYGKRPSDQWQASLKTSYGTIAQGPIIRRKDDAFMVRLPYAREPFTGTGTTASDYATGEIDQILNAVFRGRSLPTSIPAVVPPLYFNDIDAASNTWYTQDFVSATGNPIMRQGSETVNSNFTVTSTNAGSDWRPVLELQL